MFLVDVPSIGKWMSWLKSVRGYSRFPATTGWPLVTTGWSRVVKLLATVAAVATGTTEEELGGAVVAVAVWHGGGSSATSGWSPVTTGSRVAAVATGTTAEELGGAVVAAAVWPGGGAPRQQHSVLLQ